MALRREVTASEGTTPSPRRRPEHTVLYRTVAGQSPADHIADAKTLLDAGTIHADEFAKRKAKALAQGCLRNTNSQLTWFAVESTSRQHRPVANRVDRKRG